MAEALHGWVHAFTEQGMEGDVVWAFQDASFAASRLSAWEHAGLVFLGEGDHLTILEDDGTVLFSGLLSLRTREGCLGLGRVPASEGGWVPAGVEKEAWIAWMWRHPPLRAVLTRATGRAG